MTTCNFRRVRASSPAETFPERFASIMSNVAFTPIRATMPCIAIIACSAVTEGAGDGDGGCCLSLSADGGSGESCCCCCCCCVSGESCCCCCCCCVWRDPSPCTVPLANATAKMSNVRDLRFEPCRALMRRMSSSAVAASIASGAIFSFARAPTSSSADTRPDRSASMASKTARVPSWSTCR